MYFKGFKIAATVNFAILVIAGMILINIVVTILWQQHATTLAINRARLSLSIVENSSSALCQSTAMIDFQSIGAIFENAKDMNMTFAMHSDGGTILSDNSTDPEISQVLQQASLLQHEIIRSQGNYFSILGRSPKEIIVASPANACAGVDAFAVKIFIPQLLEQILAKQSIVFVYVLVNTIILTTLWFFRIRRLVMKPLDNLVEMSQSLGVITPDFFIKSSSQNEFGQLASALSNMIRRIEADKVKLGSAVKSLEEANARILENQQTLVEAEKFAAVGKLSAGMAHEIGNPLGIIQGYIELLGRDDINENERKQYRKRADRELSRVVRLIQQLLNLARKKSRHDSKTFVVPVVNEVVNMLRQQKSNNHITFSMDFDKELEKVRYSEGDLHQVLLNCLLNSIDAISEQEGKAGAVNLSCKRIVEDDGIYIYVVIQDNGMGISRDEMPSIFDPFFTTKDIGRGTGLGLSVSRSIIENSGGTIIVESEESVYTRVIVKLPVV